MTPSPTVVEPSPIQQSEHGHDEKQEHSEPDYLVRLDGSEHPQNKPLFQKWLAVAIICSASTCVTCASSVVSTALPDARFLADRPLSLQASFTQKPMQEQWHVSTYVTILGISLFVEGLGFGPLLLGPMSEFFGRNAVYWSSFSAFVLLNLPVALAPNIG